ncbi:MAG: A/G-specific adenine glycosylase [Treponema sp.]|nr:A/G-specific adenine glycosylase [Treponema sp.]
MDNSSFILPNGSSVQEFQSMILDFYRQEGRSFPWRETCNPYEILVSELMLQQTQTERVVPKYLNWLQEFPTAQALAQAPFSQVLTAWSGLGYNRRAGYLQEACRQVVEELGGVFPSSARELEKLRGVGPYTARAVATFAFNKPEVFIETNIRSVYLFLFFPRDNFPSEQEGGHKDSAEGITPAKDKVADSSLMPLIEVTLYHEDPRSWYYALMDYGARLKKSTANPNRRSLHYSRQSKFQGSLRQARGAIVKSLAQTQGNILSLKEIEGESGIELYRLESAAESLVAEGMICRQGDLYCINENR